MPNIQTGQRVKTIGGFYGDVKRIHPYNQRLAFVKTTAGQGYYSFSDLEIVPMMDCDTAHKLSEVLQSQCDSMAFILNHCDVGNFYEKFKEELRLARDFLSKARGE